ncbi:MBL fold metallo-hydrolase [Actibacterium ureilyticum]|uniref:MBL fold metallo-hydrolase n=1 Tax=Actibacterium ureilyticum TaxID=1590614 RepID=UPI000BAABFCE|nr:MBL fold metallo-hydrolase [Actibacterium ureilyticum]
MTLSRRTLLGATAALPLAGLARPALAAAPMQDGANAPFHRFKLGGFEVTTLLAGTRTVPDPHTIFGLNASDEDFAAVSQDAFIPTDKAQFFFTPTLVNTGSELVLFDTGLAPEGIGAALSAAGYSTDQVDKVVITHMHGDHIGGLAGDAGATFANAAYMTGTAEFDHWNGTDNEGFAAKVKPLADQFTFLDDGGSVASGITAMAAFGHTPGHMAYMLESDGQGLLVGADFANHYVWSLGHPDWEVKFDMDKSAAAATRRRLLDMLAADKLPFIGYHMPFPGFGFVETRDSGFRYVPASYQMMLG